MEELDTTTARALLDDERYRVPACPPAAAGVAWLRANVVRFSEGEAHRRRRSIVTALLADVDPGDVRRPGDHVANLAAALGLPRGVRGDVVEIARCHQPHLPTSAAGDAAVERLVALIGERDERAAALIGLLVQACDSTAAMIAGQRPPVAATRRVAPDGTEVVVPLDGLELGSGRHACPGGALAEAMVDGATAFRRLHEGPHPLVLPNAWDVASARLFAAAGFPAVGTTSLGVAAAAGVADATGDGREPTLALAVRLADLDVPVTVDIESGWGDDPVELGALLSELGIAGVNVEDGRGAHLADAADAAAVVAGLKHGAPQLFVNARVDRYWLRAADPDTFDQETERRARCYVDAGADGIFVPAVGAAAAIERLAARLPVPLNVLADRPIAQLAALGVRRVSTGSLPYRAALGAALDLVHALAGREPSAERTIPSYDEIDALVARPAG